MNQQPLPEPQPVIKLENLNKQFEMITETPQSILELLISQLPHKQTAKRYHKQQLTAVSNINLEVLPGQCLGIIGQNGSGKSTLLKLIARILRPNTGRIMVRGRVSALLELGTGFHPDLTGRENIYLNAAILGLSKEDVETHFDAVIAFSELEAFIDTPVKYYSSGMYMRLGFSIAVHVNPQLLIIDEILAVGDQAFQEKCITHIFEMKRKGVTIVLVSHNLDILRKLCTHLLWMDKGEMRAYGATETLIQQYLSFLFERGHHAHRQTAAPFQRLGTGDVEITAVRLLDKEGNEREDFITGDVMTVELRYMAHKPVLNPEFGLAIHRQDGVQVSGPNTQFAGLPIERIEGIGVVRYRIPDLPLLPAQYVISTAIHNTQYALTYDHHVKAYPFQVGSSGNREIFGLVHILATWEWEPQQP